MNVEEIHKDFSNLKKLDEIFEQLKHLTADPVKADELHKELQKIRDEIAKIDVRKSKTHTTTTEQTKQETKEEHSTEEPKRGGWFSFGKRN